MAQNNFVPIFNSKVGVRLVHFCDLYSSKYGIYSKTCTNGHLCKTDTSLLRTFYLSPFIFHYILCLKYTCYYGHLSNAYNGQMICAQEALIRLNEPV